MYETIKNYISRYSWIYYICAAVFILLFGRFIFDGGNDSDYQRATDHLERVKSEQRESLELNQTVKDSIDRSTSLNREAGERITRIEVYQQQARDRIDESASRLDEAERLLERNERLIERVEQGHQAQQGDRTTATQTTQHVGAD
jgi:hypothetical protein